MTMPPHSVKKLDAGRIPGPAAVPGTIEIVCDFQLTPTRQARIALNGRNLGTFTPSVASANGLLTSLGSAWESNLGLYMATTTIFGAVIVRDMTLVTNPAFLSSGSGPVGTSASVALPFGVALVLTENIIQRGRGAKGRMYLPGWASNADASGGVAIPAVQTAMNAMGIAWINALTAAGMTACVAKPARQEYIGFTGAHHPARAAAPVDVTAYTCRDVVWDQQRRRRAP
jgi:hypothetical protein